jgi:hypothetical protein
VGLRAALDAVEKKKNLVFIGTRPPTLSVVHPTVSRITGFSTAAQFLMVVG